MLLLLEGVVDVGVVDMRLLVRPDLEGDLLDTRRDPPVKNKRARDLDRFDDDLGDPASDNVWTMGGASLDVGSRRSKEYGASMSVVVVVLVDGAATAATGRDKNGVKGGDEEDLDDDIIMLLVGDGGLG